MSDLPSGATMPPTESKSYVLIKHSKANLFVFPGCKNTSFISQKPFFRALYTIRRWLFVFNRSCNMFRTSSPTGCRKRWVVYHFCMLTFKTVSRVIDIKHFSITAAWSGFSNLHNYMMTKRVFVLFNCSSKVARILHKLHRMTAVFVLQLFIFQVQR